mmetsp:Transcript_36082/g.57965  ORF Transcript_36082/g.57965 Transcript_36082/m.57965 type:complete len:279 (-) Transcript_36082:97-933(-)|eukprot:CAMPEP_0197030830 /NCGR_PEP_ID=MMETSP1384-20130603/9979_1 /TAXON_ID=29189 /ORGANISM="Ammonia sp." /LENGTH=278 /DNA_ID=CAMNT_0042460255 /DNA_START=37 /DNA_END=873 /DNA_ORIENTATION=+
MSLIVVATILGVAYSQTVGNTGWNMLETTWNLNVFDGFYPVPLTVSAAQSKGWQRLLKCGDTGSPGNVYTLGGDLSSMPIYNADGNIAGIILGMVNPGASEETSASPFVEYTMENGTTFWGVQGTFRDPSTICTAGTSGNVQVGDRLWFPNGNGRGKTYAVPLTRNESALAADGWVLGACFPQMGYHYWRYMTVNMNCNDTYAIFLLYNGGKLNAWGIALGHDDRPTLTSYRWEHPSGSEIQYFFAPNGMPACLPKQGVLTTQHIFMTNPAFDNCPLE